MFLFELLFTSIVHLAMVGLNVIGFFVVIRMLTLRWPAGALLALDRIGQPVTDPLIAAISRAISCERIIGESRLQPL